MRQLYIAAPWVSRADVPAIADMFEREGYHITERWWEHRDVPNYPNNTTPAEDFELRQQAIKDVNGVILADALVLLNTQKSEGKIVEMGIAIACRKPVIVVGARTNLFCWLESVYNVVTVNDALRVLPRVLHCFR